MKCAFLIALLLIAGCSNPDGYNRGYVISKSQLEPEKETPAEAEPE